MSDPRNDLEGVTGAPEGTDPVGDDREADAEERDDRDRHDPAGDAPDILPETPGDPARLEP